MSLKFKIKTLLLFPFTIPHLLSFCLNLGGKNLICCDINRQSIGETRFVNNKYFLLSLLLINMCVFRNIFYYRIGRIRIILKCILPGIKNIEINSKNIGGGLVLVHGYNVVINRKATIGHNCTIFHNVTIGENRKGVPIIGNNVQIGCGAIIIGPVHIGNQVKIGAGALVIDDVPDNATVIGNKAQIKAQ